MKIQDTQNVAYVGTLAGYPAGVYEMAGNLVLVTSSPKFIAPKVGEWPMLARLFEGMFVYEGLDQRPYFYGWLKMAMASLRARHWRASQMLALSVAKSNRMVRSPYFFPAETIGNRDMLTFLQTKLIVSPIVI